MAASTSSLFACHLGRSCLAWPMQMASIVLIKGSASGMDSAGPANCNMRCAWMLRHFQSRKDDSWNARASSDWLELQRIRFHLPGALLLLARNVLPSQEDCIPLLCATWCIRLKGWQGTCLPPEWLADAAWMLGWLALLRAICSVKKCE
jgi:hypothetical protein